jgi:hypothetical protein
MDFKDYVRKPFTIKAVEVTDENFEEVAAFCGKSIQVTQKGDRFILVNRRIIPTGTKIFVGWWITVMDDNIRCYPPRSFESQFTKATESGEIGSSIDNALSILDEVQKTNREIIDILDGNPEQVLTTNSPIDLEVDED